MESKTERPRSARPVLAAAISMVLGDHDLLCEILLRLAFSDSLVRAAAVCRLWLLTASDPAFLRRFRELHNPAGLLGFYVTAYLPHHNFGVDFVPMQHHPPEVAALLRRVPFRLDAYVSQSTRILDCRAGRVVARLFSGEFTNGVYTPLNPARGLDVFPRLPMTDAMEGRSWIFQEMLSKESANEVSYIWFTLELEHSVTEDRATGCVFELQDDAWCLRHLVLAPIGFSGDSSTGRFDVEDNEHLSC